MRDFLPGPTTNCVLLLSGGNLRAMRRKLDGNSREYILNRLERDGHLALLEGVRAGRVTAYAASIYCGYTRRPPSIASSQGRESIQGKRIRWALQRVLADGG